MQSIEEVLDEIERLHSDVMTALVQSDALLVEKLVAKQSECMTGIHRSEFSQAQKQRLLSISRMIGDQQVLINQASKVAEYFLKQVYRDSAYSGRG